MSLRFKDVAKLRSIPGIYFWVMPVFIIAGFATIKPEQTSHWIVATALLSVVFSVSALWASKKFSARQIRPITNLANNFETLLETAPDAVIICDQDGVISYFNAQSEQWFGYRRDEIIGKKMELLLPTRIREQHVGHRTQFSKRPTLRPMGVGKELYAMRRDGTEFPVEISLSPMRTAEGVFVTAIVRDISQRKMIEAEREQAQTRYRELVDTLPVGVFSANVDGIIVDANQMMTDIFETTNKSNLIGRNLAQLFLIKKDWPEFAKTLDNDQTSMTGEFPAKTANGKIVDIQISVMKKRAENGTETLEGVIQDISLRKQSEKRVEKLNDALREQYQQLEENNRELETFSYSVSHDLRAPLRAIDGFSRTLVTEYAEKLDEKGRDRLQRVRAAAQNMGALIDDLLSLSRITRHDVKYETTNLSSLADQVIQTLTQAYPDRNVQTHIGPNIITKGDARLLRVIMDNLIGNAWKFTLNNAHASIEFGRVTEGGREVFFVKDNGVGFDMKFKHKLFGAFQRLHDAKDFPGNGIGLATVHRAVKKHGGQVWAESVLGQGTTFYFNLTQGDSE